MTIKERVKRVSKIFHTESKESLDKQIAAAGEDKDATITDAPASDTIGATNAEADVAANVPTAAENNNTTTITDAADIPEPTINATEGEVKEVEVKEEKEKEEEEAAPVAVTVTEPAAAPIAPEATATVPEATATETEAQVTQATATEPGQAEAEAEAEDSNKATATESTPAVEEKVSRKHDFFRKLYSKFRKPVVAKT